MNIRTGNRSRHLRRHLSRQPTAILLILILLAFTLRVYQLDGQSLWSDEYITLLRSTQPVGEMLAEMPAEHTPLYFLLQHAWLRAAGESDIALRFPSVIGGVLAIPLIYLLAQPLFGRSVGMLAALIIAINPFQIWYAQDARMYTLVTAFVLGSLACLVRALRRDRRAWWLGYGLFTLLAAYTHYYAALGLLAGGSFAALWLAFGPSFGVVDAVGRRSRLTHWMIAVAAVAATYLPWLPRALGVLSFPGWRPAADLASIPGRYLTYYSVGTSMPLDSGTRWTWGFLVLAGLGAFELLRRRNEGAAFLAVYLLAPLVVVVVQALRTPDFHERYFLTITPAYYLLVAVGIVGLPHILPARLGVALATAGVLFIGATAVFALRSHYYDPAFAKADYKAYTAHVQAIGRPSDALVLYGPGHGLTERYGGESRVNFPRIYNLRSTSNRDKSQAEIEVLLAEIAEEHGRVWLAVQFRDPGEVKDWFERHGYAVEGGWLHNFLLYYYAFASQPTGPPEPPVSVTGDAPVEVAGYRVQPGAVEPGDIVRLTVLWAPQDDVPFDGKVSARLRAPDGNVVASLDRQPLGGLAPTTNWAAGETVEDRYGLRVPPNSAAGDYQIRVILYDSATLEEHLRADLGTVQVVPDS